MSTASTDLLAEAYGACDPQEPLPSDDPRNLDLDVGGDLRGPKWANLVVREIELSRSTPVLRLFTGLPGSGKSTELRRALAQLDAKGFLTVLIDGEHELDLNAPLDTPELLAVVVQAVERAVLSAEANRKEDALHETWWERITAFFKNTEVDLDKLSVTKGPLSFTAAIKTNPTLRAQFRQALEGRRTEFFQTVRTYAETLNGRAKTTKRRKKGSQDYEDRRGVVVVFDSLEKLRGSVEEWEKIVDSAERVFPVGMEDVKTLPFHAIYTVPAALINRRDGIDFMHAVKIAAPDGTPHEAGISALVELVKQRMPAGALELLFGLEPEQTELLRRIVADSGGYLRNIVATLRDAVLSDKHPISEEFLDRAFQRRVDSYKPLVTTDDHQLLATIQRNNDLVLPDREPKTRQKVEHLLTNSIVLRYQNANDWYALHPAVKALMERRGELAPLVGPHGARDE